MSRKQESSRADVTELEQILNVGPATARDLRRLGIGHPRDLVGQDPYDMYDRLCRMDAVRHDPCVLDVFIAAVEFMRGQPARPWWKYTAGRKRELQHRLEKRRLPNQTSTSAGGATQPDRRAFFRQGTLLLLAAGVTQQRAAALASQQDDDVAVRFGLMTDLHFAEKPPAGSRHYRETLAKLDVAGREFAVSKPAFIVELGDFIDSALSLKEEQNYLKRIHRSFAKLPGQHHYVLGNHCVYSLTKEEFLGIVEQPKSHYSFDVNGFHFVILDACFRADGQPYGRKNFDWTDANVPASQLDWLRADLETTTLKSIVFIHQRLDVGGHYGVKNAAAVRQVLERFGSVLAVFQGHNHLNDHREIQGIHYCTLTAMVEGSGADNNALATVEVFRDGAIRVSGFRKQKSYAWPQVVPLP